MSKKLTKDDIKSKDIMTQELQAGFTWSVKHSKLVFGLLAVFILGGVVYSGVTYLMDKKEIKVQEAFYLAEKEYLSKKEKFEVASKPAPAEAEARKGDKKKAAAPPVVKNEDKPTGDLEKDYGSSVKAFQSVIEQSPGSKAARMSALILSDMYWQYGHKEKGLDALKKINGGSDLLSLLVEDRKAALMADQGQCQEALAAWDRVLTKKESSFMAAEVKLKKGLCYESLKDFAKAQAMYTQAKEGDANSPVAKRAEKFLRLLPSTTGKTE